jgi:Aspartate carbamoyltransferase, catalytic chain
MARNSFADMRNSGVTKKKSYDYDDISASIILQSWINENIIDYMKINHGIQLQNNKLKHFLNIQSLPKAHILEILLRAEDIHNNNEISQYPDKVVASLFFEPSTRTKTTFELTSKKISADFINIDISNSSTSKGESILDMIKTIQAMSCQMFVVRHSVAGTAHYIA